MTLTFGLDLDSVKMNPQAKYHGQKPSGSKINVRTHPETDRHTRPIALPGPLKWSVKCRPARPICPTFSTSGQCRCQWV